MTNEKLVLNMMNYSEMGAIKQAFIIEAIRQYSQAVLADNSEWDNGLISQDAWRACAQECVDSIANRGEKTKAFA